VARPPAAATFVAVGPQVVESRIVVHSPSSAAEPVPVSAAALQRSRARWALLLPFMPLLMRTVRSDPEAGGNGRKETLSRELDALIYMLHTNAHEKAVQAEFVAAYHPMTAVLLVVQCLTHVACAIAYLAALLPNGHVGMGVSYAALQAAFALGAVLLLVVDARSYARLRKQYHGTFVGLTDTQVESEAGSYVANGWRSLALSSWLLLTGALLWGTLLQSCLGSPNGNDFGLCGGAGSDILVLAVLVMGHALLLGTLCLEYASTSRHACAGAALLTAGTIACLTVLFALPQGGVRAPTSTAYLVLLYVLLGFAWFAASAKALERNVQMRRFVATVLTAEQQLLPVPAPAALGAAAAVEGTAPTLMGARGAAAVSAVSPSDASIVPAAAGALPAVDFGGAGAVSAASSASRGSSAAIDGAHRARRPSVTSQSPPVALLQVTEAAGVAAVAGSRAKSVQFPGLPAPVPEVAAETAAAAASAVGQPPGQAEQPGSRELLPPIRAPPPGPTPLPTPYYGEEQQRQHDAEVAERLVHSIAGPLRDSIHAITALTSQMQRQHAKHKGARAAARARLLQSAMGGGQFPESAASAAAASMAAAEAAAAAGREEREEEDLQDLLELAHKVRDQVQLWERDVAASYSPAGHGGETGSEETADGTPATGFEGGDRSATASATSDSASAESPREGLEAGYAAGPGLLTGPAAPSPLALPSKAGTPDFSSPRSGAAGALARAAPFPAAAAAGGVYPALTWLQGPQQPLPCPASVSIAGATPGRTPGSSSARAQTPGAGILRRGRGSGPEGQGDPFVVSTAGAVGVRASPLSPLAGLHAAERHGSGAGGVSASSSRGRGASVLAAHPSTGSAFSPGHAAQQSHGRDSSWLIARAAEGILAGRGLLSGAGPGSSGHVSSLSGRGTPSLYAAGALGGGATSTPAASPPAGGPPGPGEWHGGAPPRLLRAVSLPDIMHAEGGEGPATSEAVQRAVRQTLLQRYGSVGYEAEGQHQQQQAPQGEPQGQAQPLQPQPLPLQPPAVRGTATAAPTARTPVPKPRRSVLQQLLQGGQPGAPAAGEQSPEAIAGALAGGAGVPVPSASPGLRAPPPAGGQGRVVSSPAAMSRMLGRPEQASTSAALQLPPAQPPALPAALPPAPAPPLRVAQPPLQPAEAPAPASPPAAGPGTPRTPVSTPVAAPTPKAVAAAQAAGVDAGRVPIAMQMTSPSIFRRRAVVLTQQPLAPQMQQPPVPRAQQRAAAARQTVATPTAAAAAAEAAAATAAEAAAAAAAPQAIPPQAIPPPEAAAPPVGGLQLLEHVVLPPAAAEPVQQQQPAPAAAPPTPRPASRESARSRVSSSAASYASSAAGSRHSGRRRRHKATPRPGSAASRAPSGASATAPGAASPAASAAPRAPAGLPRPAPRIRTNIYVSESPRAGEAQQASPSAAAAAGHGVGEAAAAAVPLAAQSPHIQAPFPAAAGTTLGSAAASVVGASAAATSPDGGSEAPFLPPPLAGLTRAVSRASVGSYSVCSTCGEVLYDSDYASEDGEGSALSPGSGGSSPAWSQASPGGHAVGVSPQAAGAEGGAGAAQPPDGAAGVVAAAFAEGGAAGGHAHAHHRHVSHRGLVGALQTAEAHAVDQASAAPSSAAGGDLGVVSVRVLSPGHGGGEGPAAAPPPLRSVATSDTLPQVPLSTTGAGLGLGMFGTPSLGALGAGAVTDLAFGGGEGGSGMYGQGVVGRPVLASEARNDIEYLFDYGHEREYIQKRRARTLQQPPGSAAAGAGGAGGIARTVSGRPAPEGPASARGAGAGHGLGEAGVPADTLRGAGTSHLTQVLGLSGVQLAPTTVRGQLTDASAVLLGVPPTAVRGAGEADSVAVKSAAGATPGAPAGGPQASMLRVQAQVAGGSGTETTTPSVSASTAAGNTPVTGGTGTASARTESSVEEPHLLHPLAVAAAAAAAGAAASARETGAEGRRPPASPAGSSPPREEEVGAGVFPTAAAATAAVPSLAAAGAAPSSLAIGAPSVESPRASSEAGGSPVATPSATPAGSVDAAAALRARIGGARAEGGAAAGAGGGAHRREPLPKFNLHCLVVDDERVNRKIAGRYLQQLGCTYEAVEDGDEVVPALVMSARPFDAILLDILMSRTNGIEVCRTLREQHVEIPIIAATANYSHKEKAIYQAAGFDRVLQKPFTVKDMAAALAYATNVQLQRGINPGADKGSEASTASGSTELAGDRGSTSLRKASDHASEGNDGGRVSSSHMTRQSDSSTVSGGVGSTVSGGVGR